MCLCVALIEEGYHGSNPYHNAVHALDVAQAMHCYVNEKKVLLYQLEHDYVTRRRYFYTSSSMIM